MDYQYPMNFDWSTNEIIVVIEFFQSIEKAYEKGIDKNLLMESYRKFKEIVPSKSEEKQLCNEFEEMSGYSAYKVIKNAKVAQGNVMIRG